MQRIFQFAALALALGLLGFVACRAQSSSHRPTANAAAPAAPGTTDGGVDAAPVTEPAPDVYLPASKSGGAFLEHQQAPR